MIYNVAFQAFQASWYRDCGCSLFQFVSFPSLDEAGYASPTCWIRFRMAWFSSNASDLQATQTEHIWIRLNTNAHEMQHNVTWIVKWFRSLATQLGPDGWICHFHDKWLRVIWGKGGKRTVRIKESRPHYRCGFNRSQKAQIWSGLGYLTSFDSCAVTTLQTENLAKMSASWVIRDSSAFRASRTRLTGPLWEPSQHAKGRCKEDKKATKKEIHMDSQSSHWGFFTNTPRQETSCTRFDRGSLHDIWP
jgi:hypothetical protein